MFIIAVSVYLWTHQTQAKSLFALLIGFSLLFTLYRYLYQTSDVYRWLSSSWKFPCFPAPVEVHNWEPDHDCLGFFIFFCLSNWFTPSAQHTSMYNCTLCLVLLLQFIAILAASKVFTWKGDPLPNSLPISPKRSLCGLFLLLLRIRFSYMVLKILSIMVVLFYIPDAVVNSKPLTAVPPIITALLAFLWFKPDTSISRLILRNWEAWIIFELCTIGCFYYATRLKSRKADAHFLAILSIPITLGCVLHMI
uniref:Uncharacterized protein n=1 Tax=Vannella robusta TaxID=1487602 RepID=A0A7S4IUP9_9EUKA